eukprot:365661-Chlamydomonas_euryale.AAC.47
MMNSSDPSPLQMTAWPGQSIGRHAWTLGPVCALLISVHASTCAGRLECTCVWVWLLGRVRHVPLATAHVGFSPLQHMAEYPFLLCRGLSLCDDTRRPTAHQSKPCPLPSWPYLPPLSLPLQQAARYARRMPSFRAHRSLRARGYARARLRARSGPRETLPPPHAVLPCGSSHALGISSSWELTAHLHWHAICGAGGRESAQGVRGRRRGGTQERRRGADRGLCERGHRARIFASAMSLLPVLVQVQVLVGSGRVGVAYAARWVTWDGDGGWGSGGIDREAVCASGRTARGPERSQGLHRCEAVVRVSRGGEAPRIRGNT